MPDTDLPRIDITREEYDRYYAPRYTTVDITKHLDITMEKLRDIINRGFIKPSEKSPGQGKRALFSRLDIYGLELFQYLVKKGFSRKLASTLSQQFVGVDSPLKFADCVVFVSVVREREEAVDTVFFAVGEGGVIDVAPLVNQPGFKDIVLVKMAAIRERVDSELEEG